MEKYICQTHNKPKLYLCADSSCEESGPICAHRECRRKHCHRMQITIVPIGPLVKQLKERMQSNKEKIEQIRGQISRYLKLLQEQLMLKLEEEERQVLIIEKIFLNLNDLTPQITQTLELAQAGDYQKIKKKALSNTFKLLKVKSADETDRTTKISHLQAELNSRLQNFKKFTKFLAQSKDFQDLYKFSIYDPNRTLRYNRFEGETTTWTFDSGKIDAIRFTVSEPVKLVSYVHFGITQWRTSNQVKLKVIMTKGDKQPIFQKQFLLQKDKLNNNDFDIDLQPVELQPGAHYDIYATNVGGGFSGKHGSTSKQCSGPFKFFKSSHDTNGTSATGGQFRAFNVMEML